MIARLDHAMRIRIIQWDDISLPFGNSPSIAIPTIETLREDVGAGYEWHWFYRGLLGVITIERMRNALDAWDRAQMQRHRREPVSCDVGIFRWSDVVSVDERQKMADAGPDADATPGREPHN
jgi:hypothetical protein